MPNGCLTSLRPHDMGYGSTCGVTTLYTTKTITTSIPTTYTTITSLPPYGETRTVNYTTCLSYSKTNCVSSTTLEGVLIIDHWFGENVTTTVTTAVPRTMTRIFPTATSTIPCHPHTKRDGEEIELLDKRGAALPSIKLSSKTGMIVLGALVASVCLL